MLLLMGVMKLTLDTYLEKHGMTIYEFAKHVEKIKRPTLYGYIQGRHFPSGEALALIIDALREITKEETQLQDILVYDPDGTSEKRGAERHAV